MRNLRLVFSLGILALTAYCLYGLFDWTINRVYVEPGQSLMLRYKGPLIFGSHNYAKPGHFAQPGEIGVLEEMCGPGRHFYCPIWWERTIVKDFVVNPGEVAIVTSKLGDQLDNGQFLVDGDLGETKYKGILRKVFGPGRYRVNPYSYDFKVVKTVEEKVGQELKHSGWVYVPTGYVGVVTYLTDNPAEKKKAGIQDNVLPSGLYPINPREMQVDIVSVGYTVTEVSVERKKNEQGQVAVDESGEEVVVENSGISFPSTDGFKIHMDFSAIWGIMPAQAPNIIRTFGNLSAVENKVILPQCESICRNNGSKLGAVELLVGDSRQKFQDDTTTDFEKVLKEKDLTLLYGLVRHVYIPQEVRLPIQSGYIAEELKLTREQEKLTAETEAKLREEEKKVEQATMKIAAETKQKVASVVAEGQKTVESTAAETEVKVAAIDKQVAELTAKKTVLAGEAENKAKQIQAEAKAEMFGLAVKAFGTPDAYTMWQFADSLPEDIKLQLLYAGEGTFWTDVKGLTPIVQTKK